MMTTNRELIRNLPDSICWKIAKALDKSTKPNWKTLISKMPRGTYKNKDINKFHMKILKLEGSPTIALLTDLGRKNKLVSELIDWLNQMDGKFSDLIDFILRGDEAIRDAVPDVIKQPKYVTSCLIGSCCTISFEVKGLEPLQYQWFRGAQIMQGQTCKTLVLNHVSSYHAGIYICRIHNDYGYAFTSWANVEVVNEDRDLLEINLRSPVITMQPRSQELRPGGTLVLQGDAFGSPLPAFQWYFQNEPLLYQCRDQLIIQNVQPGKNDGLYKLKASNKFGSVFSFVAQVRIEKSVEESFSSLPYVTSSEPSSEKGSVERPRGPYESVSIGGISLVPSNNPTDKIALLIGNERYQYHKELGKLIHPINDTREIAAALIGIGFKVVSLVNLDLEAMRKAVHFFYSLIEDGSYILFYFAGHGFEKDGESYMMPINATPQYVPEDNLSLSDILLAVTTKRTKLSVVLVDCCRTDPKYCRDDPIPNRWREETVPIQSRNVTIGFGCCSRGRVLESPKMQNSYFAKSLAENLVKDIKIDDVLFEVSKSIRETCVIDPATGRSQVVHRHSTVAEDLRLRDPIQESTIDSPHAILWKQANTAPDSPVTIFSNSFVEVKLSFVAEFSNCLLIHSDITPKKSLTDLKLMFILPEYLGGSPVKVISPEEKGGGQQFIRISNLEKLEGDIDIHMELTFQVDGTTRKQIAFYGIKERPLYAKIVKEMESEVESDNDYL